MVGIKTIKLDCFKSIHSSRIKKDLVFIDDNLRVLQPIVFIKKVEPDTNQKCYDVEELKNVIAVIHIEIEDGAHKCYVEFRKNNIRDKEKLVETILKIHSCESIVKKLGEIKRW